MKKLFALPLALAALAVSAVADVPQAHAEPTATFRPLGVLAGYADGGVFIRAGEDIGSGCANKTTVAAKTDSEKVFSLALAAFLSGKNLRCERTSACVGTAPYQYSVVQQCQIVD